MTRKRSHGLDILVEDINETLWVAGLSGSALTALEIDPAAEIIRWGSIYWAKIIRIDAGLNAAFVDLGYGLDAFLPAGEVPHLGKAKLGQKLKAGQMVLVQVKTAHQPSDDPDAKLAVVSMDIALQGRFMIYTPNANVNRVSRRVVDKTLRAQMTAMAKSIDSIHGCILRLAAANCQTDVLIREGEILKTIWDSLQEYAVGEEPCLLMLGPDALQRVLSDHAATTIGSIVVSNDMRHEEADTWCDLYAPELRQRLSQQAVNNTRSGMGLFEARDILGQVEGLVKPSVSLKGGNIHIEPTEALTAIDVNADGKTDVLSLNLLAADEVARQIRLRNLGGLIVVDFAGSLPPAHAKQVKARLDAALALDPSTVEAHGPTRLGLFEMARKRRTPSLADRVQLLETDA